MSVDLSSYYAGLPYLMELESALREAPGDAFSVFVKHEVGKWDEIRDRMIEISEDTEGLSAQQISDLERDLREDPSHMQHQGATILGPRVMARGRDHALAFVMNGSNGKRYVVGYVLVSCELDGTVVFHNYESLKGKHIPYDGSIRYHESDDLSHANASADRISSALDSFGNDLLRYADRTRSSGGMYMSADDDEDEEDDADRYTRRYRSKSKSKLHSNLRSLYSNDEDDDEEDDDEQKKKKKKGKKTGDLSSEAVRRILDNSSDRPLWYTRFSFRDSMSERLEQFMEEVATPVYNDAKKEEPDAKLKDIWTYIGVVGEDEGYLRNWCKTKHEDIEMEGSKSICQQIRQGCVPCELNSDGHCGYESYMPTEP